jgi:hypothetical protein
VGGGPTGRGSGDDDGGVADLEPGMIRMAWSTYLFISLVLSTFGVTKVVTPRTTRVGCGWSDGVKPSSGRVVQPGERPHGVPVV